jgi:hypothetical protein
MGRSTGVGHGRGRRQEAAGPDYRRRWSRRMDGVGRDAWGANCRAAARSGGQPGGGEVGRMAGRRAVGHTHGAEQPGGERSGTHVGARQSSGDEIGRDARGPDGRAAAGTGGQPGDGEVMARSGRVCGRVCGHEALSG